MNGNVNTAKEMDKSVEAKPSKRYFKQSVRHKLFSAVDGVGGGSVSLEKSKKGKVRRLSVVGKSNLSNEEDDSEMGFDKDYELGNRRLKLPEKFFVDSNGVDYAMVPRKLRSAMKKRSCESISPPFPESKKLNHLCGGVKSSKKNGLKESELNMKIGGLSWSQKQNISGSITKDEEEVVETLSSLAEMFTNNEENDRSKLGDKSSRADIPALTGERGSAASKDDMNSIDQTVEAVNPSSLVGGSPKEAMRFYSAYKSAEQEQPDLRGSKQLAALLKDSTSKMNLHSMLLQTKHIVDTSCDRVNFVSDSSLYAKWRLPNQLETLPSERKSKVTPGLAIAVGHQLEQHSVKECNENAFWPSLSTTTLHGVGCYLPSRSSLGSSISKSDAPLDAALTKSSPFRSCFPTEKISKIASDRRPCKRCATHMYISRFIQVQQTAERGSDGLPEQPDQLKQNEESRQEIVRATDVFNIVRNISNGSVTTSSAQSSAATSFKASDCIPQSKRGYQDQQNAAGVNLNQKQSGNFLSLSSGGSDAEDHSNADISRNGLERFIQGPGVHQLARFQTLLPFRINQTCFSSSSDPYKLQLPAYMSASFIAHPCSGSSMATQQHSQKQQHQQQMLWAAHVRAQFRPVSPAMRQAPNWQNGRQEAPFLTRQGEDIAAPPSLEAFGSKYSTMSQQQHQQIMARASLPAKFSRQSHNLPPAHEESGVELHAGGTLPLQLLCNDR